VKKIFIYASWLSLLIVPLLIYPFATGFEWSSGPDLHGSIEIAAFLFALCAAVMILTHFFAIGDKLYLIVGLGFLIAGAEDLVHGIISLARFGSPLAGYEKFIPATYTAGRMALVLMFIIGAAFESKKRKVPRLKGELFIYGIIALAVGALATYLAVRIPLPRFIYSNRIITRPADLAAGLFYLLAVFLYVKLYFKNKDPFHWSLVASLIFGVLTQLYMVRSRALYDAQFDISHLFKVLSYVWPVLGVGGGTILLYRRQEAASEYLAYAKRELEARQDEIVKKNIELEEISKGLDSKVKERTKDLADAQAASLNMLEDLSEAKDTLDKYSKKLEDAVKIKSDFTSMVSHELRTPLTAIKEGISIVLDGTTGRISGEQKDFLETAKRNVDRLARLINDILDFQKLESGKFEFRMLENDINTAVLEVRKQMLSAAKAKNLTIDVKLDKSLPKLKFDYDRILQVLANIVSNSIKFTEIGGITITTRKDAKDNAARVSVKDTGPGIGKKDLPRMFQRFEQLKTGKDRKTGGTGLGLAISKEIINRQRGKIWVESKLGRGATFHFILPLKARKRLT